MTTGQQGDTRGSVSVAQVRAEWIRSAAFIAVFAGSTVMAIVDVTDNTAWWLVGLVVAAIGASGLAWAAMRIPSARAIFGALFRRRFGDARAAIRDLNRVPSKPEPHRRPRQLARAVGPLSALAALAAVLRLLTI